jgi:hypothetical protein
MINRLCSQQKVAKPACVVYDNARKKAQLSMKRQLCLGEYSFNEIDRIGGPPYRILEPIFVEDAN